MVDDETQASHSKWIHDQAVWKCLGEILTSERWGMLMDLLPDNRILQIQIWALEENTVATRQGDIVTHFKERNGGRIIGPNGQTVVTVEVTQMSVAEAKRAMAACIAALEAEFYPTGVKPVDTPSD